MSKTAVQFRHNGVDVAVFVDGGANLLTALREGVGDIAPKYGCGQGTCGVCTVLIDGDPYLSCLTLAETCQGHRPIANSALGASVGQAGSRMTASGSPPRKRSPGAGV